MRVDGIIYDVLIQFEHLHISILWPSRKKAIHLLTNPVRTLPMNAKAAGAALTVPALIHIVPARRLLCRR